MTTSREIDFSKTPLAIPYYVDAAFKTNKALTGLDEKYSVYACIFSKERGLLWSGVSLDHAAVVLEEITSAAVSVDDVFRHDDDLAAICELLKPWVNTTENFSPIHNSVRQLHPSIATDEQAAELLLFIMSWIVNFQQNQIPALIPYWSRGLSEGTLDIQSEMAIQVGWFHDREEAYKYETPGMGFTFSKETNGHAFYNFMEYILRIVECGYKSINRNDISTYLHVSIRAIPEVHFSKLKIENPCEVNEVWFDFFRKTVLVHDSLWKKRP